MNSTNYLIKRLFISIASTFNSANATKNANKIINYIKYKVPLLKHTNQRAITFCLKWMKKFCFNNNEGVFKSFYSTGNIDLQRLDITSIYDFPTATNKVLRERERPPKFDQDNDLLVLLQGTEKEGSLEDAVITIFFRGCFTQNVWNKKNGLTSITKQMEEACFFTNNSTNNQLHIMKIKK